MSRANYARGAYSQAAGFEVNAMYKTSLDYECPTCGARPASSCVCADGAPRNKLHPARIVMASKKDDVRELQDKIKIGRAHV